MLFEFYFNDLFFQEYVFNWIPVFFIFSSDFFYDDFFFESIFDLSAGTFPFSYGWIRKGVANRGKQFGSLRSRATEIEFYAERRY